MYLCTKERIVLSNHNVTYCTDISFCTMSMEVINIHSKIHNSIGTLCERITETFYYIHQVTLYCNDYLLLKENIH